MACRAEAGKPAFALRASARQPSFASPQAASGLPSRSGKARLRPSGFGAAAFACFAAGCEWLAEPKLAKQAKAGGGGRREITKPLSHDSAKVRAQERRFADKRISYGTRTTFIAWAGKVQVAVRAKPVKEIKGKGATRVQQITANGAMRVAGTERRQRYGYGLPATASR